MSYSVTIWPAPVTYACGHSCPLAGADHPVESASVCPSCRTVTSRAATFPPPRGKAVKMILFDAFAVPVERKT